MAGSNVLEVGQAVRLEGSGMECRVDRFLGGGGQGEVYRATLAGQPIALKWYFPSAATFEQRKGLATLIGAGAPNDRFLWPMELATAAGIPGFGYIMPLREDRYKGFVDLMKRRINPSFRALTTAGLGLVDSFLQLHAKGLCYRDISFGNVFFDPKNGDVLICDNDNVTVDGATVGGILGTPRFMAPEVVRGEVKPDRLTDLFSLSVLLFYMLMSHHPLEGKKEADIHAFDLPAMTKLYGLEPVFIFDPNDLSNRPVPGYQDNALTFWPLYPKFLRDLFTRAFTEGAHDRHGRVQEGEWRVAMVRVRDALIYCRCGAQNFYDADALKESGGKPGTCWNCQRGLRLPPRIRVGRRIVMLNHDTKLYPHHIDDRRMYDFSVPIAEVTKHPTEPNVWGLKNLSTETWVSTTSAGATNNVPPGRNVSLAVGTTIQFGTAEGEIRL